MASADIKVLGHTYLFACNAALILIIIIIKLMGTLLQNTVYKC